jgi:hypothetical protein
MIFLDFEVFTGDKYRLSKGGMTTEDFIRDPRFQPTQSRETIARRNRPQDRMRLTGCWLRVIGRERP